MEGQARQHQGSRSEGGRPSASGRALWGGLVGVPEGGKGGEGAGRENQGCGNKKLAEFWG